MVPETESWLHLKTVSGAAATVMIGDGLLCQKTEFTVFPIQLKMLCESDMEGAFKWWSAKPKSF